VYVSYIYIYILLIYIAYIYITHISIYRRATANGSTFPTHPWETCHVCDKSRTGCDCAAREALGVYICIYIYIYKGVAREGGKGVTAVSKALGVYICMYIYIYIYISNIYIYYLYIYY
jgi:hypothetical protein